MAEGGIRSPLIISGAGVGRTPGSINGGLMHIMDVAATVLDIAGVDHPSSYNEREVEPMQGKSWKATLADDAESPRGAEDWLGW